MSAINDLRDLLVHELNDLYSAEQQILEVLPKLVEAASSTDLSKAFSDHLGETKQHVKRLEQAFKSLSVEPGSEVCAAMKGILTEGGKLLKESSKIDPQVLDAALIGAAQRVEHYEIAAYGCARTYARHLGEADCESLLQQTLDEEGHANRRLTELALSGINVKAQSAEASA